MALDMEATLNQKALYYPLADRLCCDGVQGCIPHKFAEMLLEAAVSMGFWT